jgi:1L-myo-inositol 1-phosphate cytidylyltransferase / CDP-L-myo-inositol myo-inositolphosphotransferase
VQSSDSHTAIPAVAHLILLPFVGSLDASDVQVQGCEPRILGLGLIQRSVLAARRAGYGQIFFLARDYSAPHGTTVFPNWTGIADALASSQAAPVVIAPATILSETDWLQKLAATRIEPASWAARLDRIVVLAPTAVPKALTVLDAEGGAYNMAAVQDRLTQRFGSAAGVPVQIDPIVVRTSKDIPAAERRLLSALVKETDGFMARHIDRPISLQVSRLLAPTAVTPNQITIISVVIGLCGAPFFLSSVWWWQTVGALLFLVHSIVDGCDGELARLRFQESRYGGVLDFWGDNIVHVVIFACMTAGWTLASAAMWPLLLGAAATVGTLGSASFVYWRQMRIKNDSEPLFTSVSTSPNSRLARLLDAASRRDFIYLVLILALLGKSNWILLLASLGTPMFFSLVIFLAVRDWFQNRSIRSTA